MYISNRLMFAGMLFAAPIAQANIKPLGTPVPYLCSIPSQATGASTSVVAVQGVCYGRLEGSNQPVLILRLNDSTEQIWKIRGKCLIPSRIPIGDSYSTFSVELDFIGEVRAGGFTSSRNDKRVTYLKETVAENGQILSVGGTLPGNVRFEARDFELVAVTQ